MDQVFGGEPEYSGFRPPPSATGGIAAGGENNGVSSWALTGFAAIVLGIGVGLGLPRPRARWMAGAAAGGIALAAVVVNQVMVHDRAQEGLDRAESTFRSQLGDNPIFARSFPTPVFDLDDEPGFWIVTVLLALVVAYTVWEVVALRRGPDRPGPAADSTGTPQPSPSSGRRSPSRNPSPPRPSVSWSTPSTSGGTHSSTSRSGARAGAGGSPRTRCATGSPRCPPTLCSPAG
jgi:hypothetical protein